MIAVPAPDKKRNRNVFSMYSPEESVVAEEPRRQPSGVAREKIRVRLIIGHICRGKKGNVQSSAEWLVRPRLRGNVAGHSRESCNLLSGLFSPRV